MTMAHQHENFDSPQHEVLHNAPELLIEFIRAQFEAAYHAQYSADEVERSTQNGDFYSRRPLVGEYEHEAVGSSIRIVLSAPYSIKKPSIEHEFVEIYAIFLRGEDGHMVPGISGDFADEFIVHRFKDGTYESNLLVTDDGVFEADLNEFDPVGGFAKLDDTRVDSVEEQMEAVLRPFSRAQELYDQISVLTVVATSD